MTTKIEELEDAVIALIKAELPSINTVKRYQGDFDAEGLSGLRYILPCALILYGGGSFSRVNQALTGTRRLTIFLGAKNLRSVTAARIDAYSLLEDVPGVLDHVKLSVTGTFYYLDLLSETMIYHDKNLTIYGQDYEYTLVGRASARTSGSFLANR